MMTQREFRKGRRGFHGNGKAVDAWGLLHGTNMTPYLYKRNEKITWLDRCPQK